MKVSTQVTIIFSADNIKHLDGTCRFYRWKRSQGVNEYIRFFHELREALEDIEARSAADEGHFEALSGQLVRHLLDGGMLADLVDPFNPADEE
jgi:hypothetical protein